MRKMQKEKQKRNNKQADQKGKKVIHKQLEGEVISSNMEKTIIVKVTLKKRHPLYSKVLKSSKKYKVHTERELSSGDKVRIELGRPLSKEKRWRLVEVIKGKDK